MSMTKPEIGTAIIRMTGKNTGVITNHSERNLWRKFDAITSTKLAGYTPDTMIAAVIRLSDTGRRMVIKTSIHSSVPASGASKKNTNLKPSVPGELVSKLEEKGEFVVVTQPKKKASALDGFYISPEARLSFSTARKLMLSRPERAVKVMMVGGSGYGKTTLPRLLAQRLGMNFMRMDCGKIRDSEEWFGYREAREGSTVFVRSRFMEALTQGNLIVVLDEFNRLEPWLHNTLFPMLDEDGRTVVHDEEFVIGSNVMVVGTVNDGSEYTGTFQLDTALLNRFEFVVEVGSMPHTEEVRVLMKRTGVARVEAERIVKMANALRQMNITCSTRSTLNIASFVVNGLSPRQAFETAVVLRLPPDMNGSTMRKSVVDRLNSDLGVFNPTVSWDVFAEDEESPEQVVVLESKPTEYASYELELRRRDGLSNTDIGTVALISMLRTLPIFSPVDRGTRFLTQREAQEHARSIESGNSVPLELSEKPFGFDELAQCLKDCGVGGVLRPIKAGM